MSVVTYTLLAASSIMLISLVGVLFTWTTFKVFMERNLPYLGALSAGVFGIVALHLIMEAAHILENTAMIVLYAVVGVFALWKIGTWFPESHHHESAECTDTHSKRGAKHMLIGDSLCNIADGAIIAPAFMISVPLGISATIGILTHEIVQEIGEFFLYKKAGYSTRKALALNFLSASTIFIGAGAGLVLSQQQDFLGPLLAMAGGGFIYMVIVDMMPSSYKTMKASGKYRQHGLSFVAGVVLMTTVLLFGHMGH